MTNDNPKPLDFPRLRTACDVVLVLFALALLGELWWRGFP